MPLTWSDARTKVRGDLWRSATGIPNDVCDRGLHDALLELEAERRWLWLEGVTLSGAFAAAASQFTAPVDLRSITSMMFLRDGVNATDVLTPLPLGRVRFNQNFDGLQSTWPTAYALSLGTTGTGNTIYLDSLAPAGAKFELVYTAKTPDLLEDAIAAPTNVTLQKHQTAVISNACHYIALNYLRNQEEAVRQRAGYSLRLARLIEVEDEARADAYGGCAIPYTDYQDMAYGR